MAQDTLVRRRLAGTALTVWLVWPSATVLNAALVIHKLPYYSTPVPKAILAAIAGLGLSAGEFAITASIATAISLSLFTALERRGWIAPPSRGLASLRLAEPTVLMLSIFWGASLWYPVVTAQPILRILLVLPIWLVTSLLATMICGFAFVIAERRHRLHLAALLLTLGVLAPVPSVIRSAVRASGPVPEAVLLGLDSISYDETGGWFQNWIGSRGGTTYEKAVTPALLTNAVWTSVMAGAYPSQHGVTQTFQRLKAPHAPLIEAARAAGYWTVAHFPDQLTAAVGSDAGFDDNRSGPIGWRQLILPIIHNSSGLLPLVRPLLPRVDWLASPPNLAGSFTFSLRREVDELLHTGRTGRRTFVASHLTYLHFSSYPRYIDLGWSAALKVLRAPARSLEDRSFDWADHDRDSDPIQIHQWKRQRLLEIVSSEIDRSGILEKQSRVVLFSDHGDRLGLSDATVRDPRYHRVLLSTFNLPPKSPEAPRSLVDIGYLFGLLGAHPDRPRVEFSVFPAELWARLVVTARLDWSGRVELDPATVRTARTVGHTFEPWPDGDGSGSPGFPTSPAPGTRSGRQ